MSNELKEILSRLKRMEFMIEQLRDRISSTDQHLSVEEAGLLAASYRHQKGKHLLSLNQVRKRFAS